MMIYGKLKKVKNRMEGVLIFKTNMKTIRVKRAYYEEIMIGAGTFFSKKQKKKKKK